MSRNTHYTADLVLVVVPPEVGHLKIDQPTWKMSTGLKNINQLEKIGTGKKDINQWLISFDFGLYLLKHFYDINDISPYQAMCIRQGKCVL